MLKANSGGSMNNDVEIIRIIGESQINICNNAVISEPRIFPSSTLWS